MRGQPGPVALARRWHPPVWPQHGCQSPRTLAVPDLFVLRLQLRLPPAQPRFPDARTGALGAFTGLRSEPVPEIDRAQTPKTAIPEDQEEPTIAAAPGAAPRFGFKAAEAKTIVREIVAAVSDWRKAGRQLRLKAFTLDAFASAFEHPPHGRGVSNLITFTAARFSTSLRGFSKEVKISDIGPYRNWGLLTIYNGDEPQIAIFKHPSARDFPGAGASWRSGARCRLRRQAPGQQAT